MFMGRQPTPPPHVSNIRNWFCSHLKFQFYFVEGLQMKLSELVFRKQTEQNIFYSQQTFVLFYVVITGQWLWSKYFLFKLNKCFHDILPHTHILIILRTCRVIVLTCRKKGSHISNINKNGKIQKDGLFWISKKKCLWTIPKRILQFSVRIELCS